MQAFLFWPAIPRIASWGSQVSRSASEPNGQGTEVSIELVTAWIDHHALSPPPVKAIAAFAGWSVNSARLPIKTGQPIKEIATSAGYSRVAAFDRGARITTTSPPDTIAASGCRWSELHSAK